MAKEKIRDVRRSAAQIKSHERILYQSLRAALARMFYWRIPDVTKTSIVASRLKAFPISPLPYYIMDQLLASIASAVHLLCPHPKGRILIFIRRQCLLMSEPSSLLSFFEQNKRLAVITGCSTAE
jgi:hypothetical protein